VLLQCEAKPLQVARTFVLPASGVSHALANTDGGLS
jgi:hypothetical protein